MLKRIIHIILFLSLSGLLYAKEQKTVSLSLSVAKSNRTWASNQQNTPPTADDVISVDFRTNYCLVRCLNDEQDDCSHFNTQAYLFLKENALSDIFVQKTLNFFSSQSIYLLNCIWLI